LNICCRVWVLVFSSDHVPKVDMKDSNYIRNKCIVCSVSGIKFIRILRGWSTVTWHSRAENFSKAEVHSSFTKTVFNSQCGEHICHYLKFHLCCICSILIFSRQNSCKEWCHTWSKQCGLDLENPLEICSQTEISRRLPQEVRNHQPKSHQSLLQNRFHHPVSLLQQNHNSFKVGHPCCPYQIKGYVRK
jgi:hypothetical protein